MHAYLRDERGQVVSLCNDGDMYCNVTSYNWAEPRVRRLWMEVIANATAEGVDGIFADHSGNEGTAIGAPGVDGQGPNQLCNGKGAGRTCANFTAEFRDTFNSWSIPLPKHTLCSNRPVPLHSQAPVGHKLFARLALEDYGWPGMGCPPPLSSLPLSTCCRLFKARLPR